MENESVPLENVLVMVGRSPGDARVPMPIVPTSQRRAVMADLLVLLRPAPDFTLVALGGLEASFDS